MKITEPNEEKDYHINKAEDHIKQGRVFSLKEAREIIDKWVS